MDGLLQGLLSILSWPQGALLVAGVTGGLLIGALPGFTSTMALVVLLPLSFTLAPIDGILLLIGVYVGGIGGGCIPAIALNIPGTPASAATTLDGFPLFNKIGRSEEALGIGVIASAIGGMTGALVLMTLAPQLSRFALRFGPAEYFALGVLGLTLVISVSGSSVVRGLFAAFVGAMLVMVGTDPMLGTARFTMGNVELLGGISYVAALIGLFGFSEVLQGIFSARGVQVAKAKDGIWRLARVPLATVLRILPASLRSGGLGAFIGSIPGAGADIAAFVSYEVQKQLSRDSSSYGTGEPRGIAASEAGNNANAGGAMVPMLTFGIPGDAQTAVLIASLMLHGIRPGPMLFQEQAGFVWTIFAGLLLAQFIMLAAGLFLAQFVVRLVAQPTAVLFPVISVLCVVGAFSLNNSMFDVWLMLVFGVVGYVMKRMDVPVVPVVLAMILVPMVESELRRALMLTPGGFTSLFARPIFTTILALAATSLVGSFVLQFIGTRRRHRRGT